MKKAGGFTFGFTLIEMSIVLIIISIIIVTYVIANQLIRTSVTASIISELSYYSNAKNSFRTRYNFLPGDVGTSSAAAGDTANTAIYSRDFRGYAAYSTTSSGTNSCTTLLSTRGNGIWDSIVEVDLAWIQLSYSKFINDLILFNPCPEVILSTDVRSVGIHRPGSRAMSGAGYTFVGSDTVAKDLYISNSLQTITVAFINVLRIAANGSSGDLSTAILPITSVKDIDTKIDKINTPLNGKIFVGTPACIADNTDPTSYSSKSEAAASATYSTDDNNLCVLGLAEQDAGEKAADYAP